jgi:hypothetical protein
MQLPFAKTKAERLAAGDPRLSIEERYTTHAEYVAAVASVANSLAHDRLLLQQHKRPACLIPDTLWSQTEEKSR